MAGRRSPSTPRRRLWWRRLVERSTLQRHPVSLTRQRAGTVLLAALALGFAWYVFTTRDEAIRRRAIDFLTEVTSADVEVERAQFRMFGGITLYNVRVSVPFSEQLDPSAEYAASREIFSARSLKLVHNPWRLLLGSLRVEHIVATRPQIVLAHNVDTGLRNWQLLSQLSAARNAAARAPGYRPRITLRDAVAQVVSIHKDGLHETIGEGLKLDADIRPHPQVATAFCIEVRRFDSGERTTVVFDPGARLVTNTPFVDAKTIRLQLPKSARRFFDRIALRGEVKLTRLIYDPLVPEDRAGDEDAGLIAVELRDVQCAVPLSMLGSSSSIRLRSETDRPGLMEDGGTAATSSRDVEPPPPEQVGATTDEPLRAVTAEPVRAATAEAVAAAIVKERTVVPPRGLATGSPAQVRRSNPPLPVPRQTGVDSPIAMADVHGNMTLRGGRLDLDVKGKVNGAECHVEGFLENLGSAPNEMGIDLHVRGTEVPAPEGATRGQLLTDPSVPKDLRSFLHDYDPYGEFDIDFHFVRPPGASKKVALSGELKPRGVIARCRWFPYPVEDLRGWVLFEPGHVYLKDLGGRHGPAYISVTGRIDRATRHAAATVDITASAVPLDPSLFEVLSDRYRAVWRRFDPRGAAHITVHLQRPGAGQDEPRPDWRTRVTADLVDAQVCFNEYPYPLEHVHGRVELDRERIRFVGLTGRHDEASVRIDGEASLDPAGPPAVELRIEANAMRLDETLAAALPPEGRAAFAQFQPQGRVDLAGTVFQRDRQQGLVYDLRATLHDTTLCYRQFPYQIRGVTAEVALRPDNISILSVSGLHGTADLSARGNVRRLADGFVADLTFASGRLALDQDLYKALPASLKDVWHLLRPTGTARLRTQLHYVSENGLRRQRHRTQIETTDATVCFQGFPLPLSSVSADVLVTDRHIEIRSLRGRAGTGTIEMSGEIDLRSPGKRGTLRVVAEGLTFDSALIEAMPAALRRQVASIRPTGRFDLRLDPLRFDSDAEGRTRWTFAGRLHLDGASGDVGGAAPAARHLRSPVARDGAEREERFSIVPDGAGHERRRRPAGFALSEVTGEIAGTGSVGQDGSVVFDAQAELARAVLAGWHLEDVSARIMTGKVASNDGLGPQPSNAPQATSGALWMIRDASGSAYGGEVAGAAEITFGRHRASYQASVTARDLQLGRYLEIHDRGTPKRQNAKTPRPGNAETARNRDVASSERGEGLRKKASARGAIYGNLILRGSWAVGSEQGPDVGGLAGADRREGMGEVFVRKAQIWKMPLVFAIFQVVNLTPDENVFHDGWLKYRLSRDELIFERIDLQGKAMSFVGGGRMDLRTGQLDVTLLAGSPVRIRVPFLTDILEGAARELMEVRVTGTLARPRISPQPLKSLANALRTLFPPPLRRPE